MVEISPSNDGETLLSLTSLSSSPVCVFDDFPLVSCLVCLYSCSSKSAYIFLLNVCNASLVHTL